MSILIKGMTMPTSCYDCPIGDELCCSLMPGVPALWKEYAAALKTNRRHEDCPLVPVPPHGRLIDADAMSERLHKLVVNFYSAYEKDGKDERLACLLEIDLGMRKVIYAAPTIIEAEEGDE